MDTLAYRRARGISQQTLALELGCHRTFIEAIERGRRRLPERFRRLLEAKLRELALRPPTRDEA